MNFIRQLKPATPLSPFFMGDPHDFVDDFVAYSPSRVFRNNFIDDKSPAVHFQQGSSSSGLGHVRDENMQPDIDLQHSHFQMFSPNEEGVFGAGKRICSK
ncbi:hypothetical protein HanRHA438_Chr16g0745521 [Helianthus annuus]|nr:hypothetical protein HanRHA438_Chr16g0745521 [Helianthus annuus]